MFISRENRRGSAKELGTSETIMPFLERQLLLCLYVNSPNHKVVWDLSFLSATIRFWRHFFRMHLLTILWNFSKYPFCQLRLFTNVFLLMMYLIYMYAYFFTRAAPNLLKLCADKQYEHLFSC